MLNPNAKPFKPKTKIVKAPIDPLKLVLPSINVFYGKENRKK
jgi:hypothetical protein